MTAHFRSYLSNLNRVRLVELVDHHATSLRHGRARPSLVVNPLSGLLYPGQALEASALEDFRAAQR